MSKENDHIAGKPDFICRYYIDNKILKQNEKLEKDRKVQSRWQAAQTIIILIAVLSSWGILSEKVTTLTTTMGLMNTGKTLSEKPKETSKINGMSFLAKISECK